ncbi:glycosyltransferase [Stenotrophomonas sp. PS02289]|uniref:glycosyltransferase n=1 Tax=Stenotrophomonas sp. PS02289 TaxID=2991422 RepID=UPI00249CA905|nr:glycosyltransferase [Stenotrophomonas sp. PS02289]
MIAMIVPAHNEAEAIGRCLAALREAATHPGLDGEEVLTVVALDACSDQTAAVCARYGAVTVAVDARCVGVARACAANHALALGARWIASTDADTTVPPDWLWKQTTCGAEAFCGIVEVVDWLDYPSSLRETFERREVAKDGHAHVHGANLGVSAAAYRTVGGFAPLTTGEDVALVRALQKARLPIAWHARPVVATSARRAARAPNGFSGFSGFLQALEREALGAGVRLLPSPAAAG